MKKYSHKKSAKKLVKILDCSDGGGEPGHETHVSRSGCCQARIQNGAQVRTKLSCIKENKDKLSLKLRNIQRMMQTGRKTKRQTGKQKKRYKETEDRETEKQKSKMRQIFRQAESYK